MDLGGGEQLLERDNLNISTKTLAINKGAVVIGGPIQ